MHIDISGPPPSNVFRDRSRYLRLALVFLVLAGCGVLLGMYTVFSEAPYSKSLENVALGLFVGPGLVFVYFAEKFMDYRKLTAKQAEELVAMGSKYPEIADYCARVAQAGRAPIMAEFEACQARVETLRP